VKRWGRRRRRGSSAPTVSSAGLRRRRPRQIKARLPPRRCARAPRLAAHLRR
jgi:hypothetical protein